MFSSTDTIVAVATPGGRAGLGIVRLSGGDAHDIACALVGRTSPLPPRQATFARFRTANGVADHVVLTYFAGPHSYTAEDVVELSAHGSPVVLQQMVREAIARGARLARPGEFTFRAFLNGRIDLTQAEAVADLIEAVTPRQARAASAQLDGSLAGEIRALDTQLLDLTARLEASLDFPDEGYHFVTPDVLHRELDELLARTNGLLAGAHTGRLLRDGARVVIVGAPNAGKSSLFNRLIRSERAIVTERPGTTRDVLVESIDLNGVPLTFVDTAGLRDSSDPIEREGVRRAGEAMATAEVLLVVMDGSRDVGADDQIVLRRTSGTARLLAVSKSDREPAWDPAAVLNGTPWCRVSAVTGDGCETLLEHLASLLGAGAAPADSPRLTNVRHIALLERCSVALSRAATQAEQLGGRAPEELVLFELNDARSALEEVLGLRTSDDVLNRVFERFCIGK